MKSVTSDDCVFKTQIDAVGFLAERGFKVSRSAFNRDFKAKKISTTPEGYFSELALLAYANALKTPTAKHEDKELSDTTKDKITHEARLKKLQADRLQIKYEKELGNTISRVEHEQDLAARALFFKKEIENFKYLHGAGIIHLVNGDQEKLAEFESFWDRVTADWLDAYSLERQFVITEDEDEDEEV